MFSSTIVSVLCLPLLASVCIATPNPVSRMAEPWLGNPLVDRTDPAQLRLLRGLRQDVINQGCEINLCFGLDGSGSISQADYTAQKNFVDLIVAITTTDKGGNYCAVQYHTSTTPISPLTGDRNTFLRKVRQSTLQGGGTNIAAGLGYTIFQLLPRTEDANKVIILGDGFDNIGFTPAFVAKPFLDQDGAICAVAVGSSDLAELANITGDPGRIFTIDGFFRISEVVGAVVRGACELN